jgi:glycosyltransferase involved in cell wall biosynthesis
MNVLAYVHLRNIHQSTGAGRVARQLIEHIGQRDGVNLRVLADSRDYQAVIPKVGQPWSDYRYHFFSMDSSVQQARWLVLNKPKAETFWHEAHIVHCTGESYVPTRKCRLVVTVHDAAYFDKGAHRANYANWKQQLKWRVLFHTLARTADLFHTVSLFSAERLATAFPAMRSRLRVVYNGVAPIFHDAISTAGVDYLRRTGLAGRAYVLLPGGLHYRKNADLVLKAWPVLKEQMKDLTLVIAGHCDPVYAAAAFTLGKSVLFAGFVEDTQLAALYHGAQAVWFPSRYEGFGLPIVESMACGTPVLASSCAAVPEIAGGAVMLANPDVVSEHVDAVHCLINDARLRSDLSERGKKRARLFTWPAAAAGLHEAYSSLM